MLFFAFAVKQKPSFCRRKSAVMPSDHHLWQIPVILQHPTLKASTALKASKGRGRLTVRVKSHNVPERRRSLSVTDAMWRAPPPGAMAHLLP